MSKTYTTLVGAPPSPLLLSWFTWYKKLLALRFAFCNVPRGITYFISNNDGSDSNDGLTASTPFKTIAKAQAILTASSGNIALLFKRGDEWLENTGIDVSKTFSTVAYYNTLGSIVNWVFSRLGGNYDTNKPFFNNFTIKYNRDGGWGTASGNRYQRAETNDIAWLRDQNDRLNPYIRVSSTALVASTVRSFFWSANVLYVNAGAGINPNNRNLESVISNFADGISLSGNGSMAKGIRCDGWGINRGTPVTQNHAYVSKASGTDEVLFMDMEGYYGASHVATHYLGGNTGGFATFINCKAGFTIYNSTGESIFNTYSDGGQQETIFHNCEIPYGTLPSDDWVTATAVVRGGALYGHSNGTAVSLIICFGMRTSANKWAAENPASSFANLPSATLITDARAFVVNCVHEESNHGGTFRLCHSNSVQMNNAYYLKPNGNSTESLASDDQPNGWAINCFTQFDMTNITQSTYGLWNNNGIASTPHIYHCHLHLKNSSTADFLMERSNYFSPANTDSGGEMINSMVTVENFTGGKVAWLGFNNNTNSKNNAFFGLSASANAFANFNSQTSPTTLGSLPVPILSTSYFNSSLYHTGYALGLEYDAKLTPRQTTPSIGPMDEVPYEIGMNSHSVLPKSEFLDINVYSATISKNPSPPVSGLISGDGSQTVFVAPFYPRSALVDGREIYPVSYDGTINFTIATGLVITFLNGGPTSDLAFYPLN